jgi:hypothetical protein
MKASSDGQGGRYFSRRSARSTAASKALRCSRRGGDYTLTWSTVSAGHRGACSMTWGSVSADRSIIASGFHPALSPNSRPIRSRKTHSFGNRLSISRSTNASSFGSRWDRFTRRESQLFRESVGPLHPRSTNVSHRIRLPNFTEVGHSALSGAGRPASSKSVSPFYRNGEPNSTGIG